MRKCIYTELFLTVISSRPKHIQRASYKKVNIFWEGCTGIFNASLQGVLVDAVCTTIVF